ncbi:MAG: hypothetical protein AB1441_03775 [Bacillota bacterium]
MRIGLNLLYLLPGVVGGSETYAKGLLEALAKISDPHQYWIFVNKETYMYGVLQERDWHVVLCGVPAKVRVERYAYEQFMLPRWVKKHRLDLLHSLKKCSTTPTFLQIRGHHP